MIQLQSCCAIYRGLSWMSSFQIMYEKMRDDVGLIITRILHSNTKDATYSHESKTKKLLYSSITLERVENAMQSLPLSNQCTHQSSIQSITPQRKQSTKQHLPSLLHESNSTFKQQHTHFIKYSTGIPQSIIHHSYSLK